MPDHITDSANARGGKGKQRVKYICGEPSLADMVRDPDVLRLMASDGVPMDQLIDLIATVRRNLRR